MLPSFDMSNGPFPAGNGPFFMAWRRLEGGRGIMHSVSEFFTTAVFERYSLPLTDAMKHGFSNLSEMAEALS